jgi:hypothetical protein
MLKLTKLIDVYEKHENGYYIMTWAYGLLALSGPIICYIYDGIGILFVLAACNFINLFQMLVRIDPDNFDFDRREARIFRYRVFRVALVFTPVLFPYWICLGLAIPLDMLLTGTGRAYLYIRDKIVNPDEEAALKK